MTIFKHLLPDFVGIGAMRSGTTWFSKNLKKHPKVFIGKKELSFFNQKLEREPPLPFLPREFGDRLRYSKFFVRGKLAGKVTGEFTPSYAVLEPEKIELFRSWLPNVKLFFVMRDPVARSWSHARKRFLKIGSSVDKVGDQEIIDFVSWPGVMARSDYASCLESWLKFYPLEQIFITYLEDIRRDPVQVMSDAYRFLGLEPYPGVNHPKLRVPKNSRAQSPMPPAVRSHLETAFADQGERLKAIIGSYPTWHDSRE
jgi:hypothetical protein